MTGPAEKRLRPLVTVCVWQSLLLDVAAGILLYNPEPLQLAMGASLLAVSAFVVGYAFAWWRVALIEDDVFWREERREFRRQLVDTEHFGGWRRMR